jgi:uncharacterized protein YecE (DUF72 family)
MARGMDERATVPARRRSSPHRNIRLGVPPLAGRFYPRELPRAKWLAYYAERFDTVELNNSFYRQPERAAFAKWRSAVPADFAYAVKLNRYITHIKRLNIERESVERSYGTLAGLGPKAGPVLVQLPPKMKFDPVRAARFFALVARRRRRHALEPRDPSWLTDEAISFLRERNVALCLIDNPRWPTRDVVTADFVYLRFHGPKELYASNYDDGLLAQWAARIRTWLADGLDVFGYFNNDVPDYAPFNALRLRELIAS